MQEIIVPEEEIIEPDFDDEENGNIDEFGAPDPLGVLIAEVLAEAAVVIPAVAPQSEADRWKDVPILDSTEELFGRRGDKKESMIPKFLGRQSGHQNKSAHVQRNPNPANVFLMFMHGDITSKFVASTNQYAALMNVPN